MKEQTYLKLLRLGMIEEPNLKELDQEITEYELFVMTDEALRQNEEFMKENVELVDKYGRNINKVVKELKKSINLRQATVQYNREKINKEYKQAYKFKKKLEKLSSKKS